MIKVTIGVGSGKDAYQAGRDAALEAFGELGGVKPSAAIACASVSLDQDQFLLGIASVLSGVPLVGGSTAGEISTDGLAKESSGIITLIASDQFTVETVAVHHLGTNPFGSGKELAIRAREVAPTARHALLFADPLSADLEDVLAGFSQSIHGDLLLSGVGVGDDLLYHETFQYRGNAAHTKSLSALLFTGEYKIATASAHGFIPVGMPEEVTKSEGNIVMEISGRPAVELYQTYFGLKHMDLLQSAFGETTANYPLGIRAEDGSHAVRIPRALSKEKGLEFFRHIPPGAEVRLMVGDIDETLEGTKRAALKILQEMGNRKLRGLLVFSSAARRRLLGPRADEEIRLLQETIGRDIPISGMYGYIEVTGIPPRTEQATLTLWGIAE